METTIEEKLIIEIARIDKRIEYLRKYAQEYKEDNDFVNAAKTDIKYRQLKMVNQALKKIIN